MSVLLIDRCVGDGAANVDVTTTGYNAPGIGGAGHYVASGVRTTGGMVLSGTTPARIRGQTTAGTNSFAVSSPAALGAADCRVEGWMYFPDGASSYQIGLALRGDTTSGTGYCLILISGTWYIYHGPSFAGTVGSTYADSISNGAKRHVALECVGTTQKAWFDGVAHITDGADATYTADGNLWLTIQESVTSDTLGPQIEWLGAVSAGGARTMGAPVLTVVSTTVTAKWSPSYGGNGPAIFQLQRAPDASGSPGAYANIGSSAWAVTATDTGLASGTYWYRLAVTDASSVVTNGAGASVTIGGSATTYTASESTATIAVGLPVTLTFQANAIPSVALVITPASTGAGTFSPTTVSSSDALTHTCTYTPSAVGSGTHTLSFTHTGGGFVGSDPASLSLTVTAAGVTIPVTDANIQYSPYNWYSGSGFKASCYAGAYFKIAVTGTTTLAPTFDLTALNAISGIIPTGYPELIYTLNDGPMTVVQMASGIATPITLTGLGGTSQLKVWIKSLNHNYDAYSLDANSVKLTGFTVDSGAVTTTLTGYYALKPKITIVYGDSIVCGFFTNGLSDDRLSDSTISFIRGISEELNSEVGVVAIPGQGINAPGNMGFPACYNSIDSTNQAYQYHFSGQSRLASTILSPAPDNAWIEHGANDTANAAFQTSYAAFLAVLRTISGVATQIYAQVPFGGFCRTQITAAVAASTDTLVKLVDCGTTAQIGCDNTSGGTGTVKTTDGIHLTPRGHMEMAARAVSASGTGAVVTKLLILH